ncbi:hypothetical protein LguiB_005803 [Lonicera macranthoides]
MQPPTLEMVALNAVIEEKYKSVDCYGGSFNSSFARVVYLSQNFEIFSFGVIPTQDIFSRTTFQIINKKNTRTGKFLQEWNYSRRLPPYKFSLEDWR